MSCERLIATYLPGLEIGSYEITSPTTDDYNCIAWALGETHRRWDPLGFLPDHWPEGLPRNDQLETIEAALRIEGFERCDDGSLVEGVEKIALFAEGARFTHVARQLSSGRWTSKLGDYCDIEHELEALVRVQSANPELRYGEIVAYMQRPLRQEPQESG